jgi:DNA-binding HxlR family transcriptional regulator
MYRKRLADMACPIARTLDLVGEWWTLLIVRDALAGARRFEEFRQTGIADNILSARLDRLVREGVLERRRYRDHPPRHEYLLTEKGRDLLPVVVALGRWGRKWTEGPGRGPYLLHTRCGTDVTTEGTAAFHCPTCGEAVPPAEVELRRRTPAPDGEPDADGSGRFPVRTEPTSG